MKLKIALLPGDGIGPEVIAQARRTLETVAEVYDHEISFEEFPVGGTAIRHHGFPLPSGTLDGCLASDAVLLGAVGSPEYDLLEPGRRPEAGLLDLRRHLGAFANLRPAVAYDALAECSPLRTEVARGADVLIVRELLGGLYFGSPRGLFVEHGRRRAVNTMAYTADEIERVARVAFSAARRRRRKVTSVDKANVLEASRLWRDVVSSVAREYSDVVLEHLYVDACAMHLITSPRQFDVLLTENLFGDILSDEAAVITGSLGMLPSASIGGIVDLYEPVHGSAPGIAGRGMANPLGAIASCAMLLRHTAGLDREANHVEDAIKAALRAGYRTPDIHRGPGERVVTTEIMGALVSEAFVEITDMTHAYHAV